MRMRLVSGESMKGVEVTFVLIFAAAFRIPREDDTRTVDDPGRVRGLRRAA